ncbi:hypothetical protein CLIB1423_20S01244 [[Candida] railenensis]|uniref:Asparaginase n=1 Tax=[Candida] railenensis TaxID=45579 RepID=A0A9P0QSV3_9ASCO|nr:hypothetical protein CLIB1423_20S01244 [[Candida] railenensis]
MKGVLIVHVGAGNHSLANRTKYKKLIGKALRAENLVDASKVLEGSSLTNTGYGSSLNIDGQVECDASFIRTRNGAIADVGSMYNIRQRYPISETVRAFEALQESYRENAMGLTMPIMIDHNRVMEFYNKDKEEEVLPDLISPKNLDLYSRYKSNVPLKQLESVTDTIGVIYTTEEGSEVASSSGGNFFKVPGRIGCAAVLGASIAQRSVVLSDSSYTISCMCSGNGEDIMLMNLARYIIDSLSCKIESSDDLSQDMVDAIEQEGRNVPLHSNSKTIYIGSICSILNIQSQRTTILYCHSTESFFFGFRSDSCGPEVILSTLETEPGKFCRGEFRI